MSDPIHEDNAVVLERARKLAELAIELRIARLKVGEIEIVPSPVAFRASPPSSPPKPRTAADTPDPESDDEDEDDAAPPRRPLTRESEPERKPHELAYYSSRARS